MITYYGIKKILCIGVKRLLQKEPHCKNVCFIDCDIHFDNIHWVHDTLTLLSSYDVIQMFNVCLDLDSNHGTMECYHSFAYQYHHHKKYFPAIKLIIHIVVMHGVFHVMHMIR